MGIINYILFILLTVLGFYYLFVQRPYQLRNAGSKNQYFIADNHQYLLLFIFATAIISCGANLMANRLMITIIWVALGIFLSKQSLRFSIVTFFYLLYLVWLIIAIFYSPVKSYGFRVLLKYLYPFLIMLFASKITTSLPFYMKALQVILYMALYAACLFILRIPWLGSFIWSFTFYGPAIIDFFPVVIALSLVYYSYSNEKKYLFFVLLFIIPSVMGAIRTGILASSITIVVFAIVRYNLKSLPYVAVGVCLLIGTVLYVPAVRDKMFVKQMSTDEIIDRGEDISKEDIDSSGRFAMWDWSLKNFYKGKEWKGSGLGVLQNAFYNEKHPFGKLKVVHNDYIQILCDTGLIGLILYALTFLSLVIHSFVIYFNNRSVPIVKFAALISGVSLAGMISTLYTDNVVNYSLMTLSFPFALYGMMLSLRKKDSSYD
ncbi:MAG: O-antigen ligase family protein [Candidatus Symbiothrix sp.]|jgi:O-antigen ligase|nr:O-antigen ligase family protein [Candidatus Symbiothrix sp.]